MKKKDGFKLMPTSEELVEVPELRGVPQGFTVHKGKEMPVAPEDKVILVIRTSEGLGFAGPERANLHEWDPSKHEDGLGAVVGHRSATKEDEAFPPDRHMRWPEAGGAVN